MPRLHRILLIAGLLLGTAGCYKAVIDTGRQPNGQTIERPWAHSFIGGLVPPSVTETASQCSGGVAQVTTQHSFLNLVAHAVTFGIYSPMTITVQCAGGDDEQQEDATIEASREEAAEAFNQAIERSAERGGPVWVRIQ